MSRRETKDYLPLVRSHLDKVIERGAAPAWPMWMSSIDIRTGAYPEDDSRPPHIGKRVYRNIDAPHGCSLYWDQPSIVAAHAFSQITGDPRYANAADEYVRAFLKRCVAANGIFLWGNHYYYDALRDQVVWFQGDEDPKSCDMETENGWLHEARPISPDWDGFWRISPAAAERCIRRLGERHVFDMTTGGFNRHADGKQGCAFLESGGILVESLCWLSTKTRDRSLVDQALSIARFSWGHRDAATGLVENNPTVRRWDKFVCTTEVGLWAQCLLRAADLGGVEELQQMARDAVSAYLKLGYDEQSGRYFGRLSVKDGSPDLSEKSTPYQPGSHADLWEPLFPTHNYPMALASACVSLFSRTGEAVFQEGCRRWVRIIEQEMPARGGRGAYAEHYGRCILFLFEAATAFDNREYLILAARLADEAVSTLNAHGMFRGHPGEDRCDAVDGVGFLLLALLRMTPAVAKQDADADSH